MSRETHREMPNRFRGHPGSGRSGNGGVRAAGMGRVGPRAEAGMSLLELVVALALMTVVGFIFQIAYKAMAGGATNVGATTEMQSLVKALGGQLESDIKRAGFGMSGASVFSTLGARELAFSYKDLLGSSCAAGQIATVRYSMEHNTLVRGLACDGAAKPEKRTDGGRDSLNLSFRYLDNAGKTATGSDEVRTVEYTVEVFSGRDPKDARKRRASSGSVSMVNNG